MDEHTLVTCPRCASWEQPSWRKACALCNGLGEVPLVLAVDYALADPPAGCLGAFVESRGYVLTADGWRSLSR